MIEFQCTGLCEIADGPVINYLETSSETAGSLNVKRAVMCADPYLLVNALRKRQC